MKGQAPIQTQTAIIEGTSEEIYASVPPRDKGLVDWEAFPIPIPSPEEQLVQMISDLPGEDQIEILVSRLPTLQLRYVVQVLSAWVSAAERLLDPRVTRVREQFIELARRWHDETDHLSLPSRITGNDTYLRVISMGKAVIPLILKDLQDRGGDWYRALRILSGTDPVPPEARGDVQQMKESWLRWGRDKGYIR